MRKEKIPLATHQMTSKQLRDTREELQAMLMDLQKGLRKPECRVIIKAVDAIDSVRFMLAGRLMRDRLECDPLRVYYPGQVDK
jgi:hypothetical protein